LTEQVETYSGHRLHEKPLRFTMQGTWLTVVQVLSRWQEPGILGFTVLAEDGQKYTLWYTQEQDLWKAALSCP
jgi:hypothetical protein